MQPKACGSTHEMDSTIKGWELEQFLAQKVLQQLHIKSELVGPRYTSCS